ncbi:MAG: phosphoribosylformylglycinamidine synthase subunit PurS, partial [Armatimonadota bacterium]
LDPAGRTVKDALQSMGYDEVSSVRVGKLIELETANGDSSRVQEMCDRLLANPVVERFEVVEVDS